MRLRVFLILSLALMLLIPQAFAELQPDIEVIYFKSSDMESPSQADIQYLRDIMFEVQAFFASEMDRHGFGKITFGLKANVRIVEGKRVAKDYLNIDMIKNEYHEVDWETLNKIDVVFLAGRKDIQKRKVLGAMLPICWIWPGAPQQPNDCNYLGVMPLENPTFLSIVVAHELGHAFGISDHSLDVIPNRINMMKATHRHKKIVKEDINSYAFSRDDATLMKKTGRLSVQRDSQELSQGIDADVNNDGYVDLSDVMIVRSGIRNAVSYQTDVNGDGKTDEVDVLIVKAKAHEALAAAAPRLQRVKLTTWSKLKTRF